MEQRNEFVLSVWRVASCYTELTAAATHIAQLLAPWMPLERLLVRRIEPERGCIETVGLGPERPALRSLTNRTNCAPAPLQRLLAWCHRGEVTRWHHPGRIDKALAVAVPPGLEGELLAGPLVSEPGTCGVVLMRAATPQCFTLLHQQMLQELLEPLAAALENDRRLHAHCPP